MDDSSTSTASTSSAPSTGTPTAAPATSAPSSPITPDQRPTFAQAFASDAAPAPESAASTAPPSTQASADILDPAAPPTSTESQGPIPFTAHKTALDNARAKERLAAQQEFDRDYGWAKQVPRESLERFGQIAAQMSSDPIGFLNTFVAELQAHPTHAAALRSQAGRLLASARGQGADPMPAPDVQITDAHGQVTGQTYSDKASAELAAWNRRQMMAEFQKELQPFKAEREQQQAQARQAETTKQVDAAADQHLGRIDRILDGDKELYQHVAQLITLDKSLDPIDAALQVRAQYVVPKLAGKAQQSVLDDLKTKAAAQGINPASATANATHKPTSFLDPALKWS